MVKSMKKVKRIIAVALVFTMLFASQVTAFAADTKATKSANKDMSIALMPGVTGDSNTVTFNYNGLPDNAIVKEVKIDCMHTFLPVLQHSKKEIFLCLFSWKSSLYLKFV